MSTRITGHILREALQKVQRDERARQREFRRIHVAYNPTIDSDSTHPTSPANSDEIELLRTNFQRILREIPSTEISLGSPVDVSGLNELEERQPLEDSPRTTTPIEHLFSQPRNPSLDPFTQTSIQNFWNEALIQPTQSIQERINCLFCPNRKDFEDTSSEDESEHSSQLDLPIKQISLGNDLEIDTTLSSLFENPQFWETLEGECFLQPEDFGQRSWLEEPEMVQRPMNLVTFPQYHSITGTDPNYHVNRFRIVCEANMIPHASYLATFPATLLGIAQEWHLTHGPYNTWDEFKNAFLARFRSLAFNDSL